MGMGGDGPWVVAILWGMTALLLIFVILRLYTRMYIIKSYGADDHVYVFAFGLFFFYTLFLHVSATYGFGRSLREVTDPEAASKALLFQYIAQTFGMLGMAIAKWSLGLFLLRLVQKTWHSVVIWGVMLILLGISISSTLGTWFMCDPIPFLWDRSVEQGKFKFSPLPLSILLGSFCIFVDFFFAIFPWIFIWRLQMKRREKIVIMSSMSLGVIAGLCGFMRTSRMPDMVKCDYLKETVDLAVWTGAEMAVTMICIGIPVCRPLYKKFSETWTKDSSTYPQTKLQDLAKRTFRSSTTRSHQRVESPDILVGQSENEKATGLDNSCHTSYAVGGRLADENNSQEEIFTHSFRKNTQKKWNDAYQDGNGILVTEEYVVVMSSKQESGN